MSYDNNQPANNAQLRNAPQLIRDNFQAIQAGDSSFKPDKINFGQQGGNAAAIASTYVMFSKSDGGNTELFGINPSSNVYQFTRGAPNIAANGELFLPGGLYLKWGSSAFVTTATTQAITFSNAFPNNIFGVQLTRIGGNDASNPEDIFLQGFPTTAAFTAKRMSASPSSGLNFYWIAIGN